MADLVLTTGIGYPANAPTAALLGHLFINQGMNIVAGRGHFTTSATTATLQPQVGLKQAAFILPAAITAGVVGLSAAIDTATGIITFTRTDTTNNGEISFFIGYL